MVFNLIINIKDGGTWGIEAREQFIYDNEQLHLGRTLDEDILCPFLVIISIVNAIAGILKRLLCPVILEFCLCFLAGISRIVGNIAVNRVVARNYGDTPSEQGVTAVLGEKLVVPVSLIDGTSHQHGVTPVVLQQAKSHIVKDAITDTLDALLCRIDFFQGCPSVFHHFTLLVGQLTSGCQCSQLLVNFLLVGKLLFYVSVFILQVEDNLVFHGLFVEIFVNVRPKCAFRHALDSIV